MNFSSVNCWVLKKIALAEREKEKIVTGNCGDTSGSSYCPTYIFIQALNMCLVTIHRYICCMHVPESDAVPT